MSSDNRCRCPLGFNKSLFCLQSANRSAASNLRDAPLTRLVLWGLNHTIIFIFALLDAPAQRFPCIGFFPPSVYFPALTFAVLRT